MTRPDIVFIPDGHTERDYPCQPTCVPSWSLETGLPQRQFTPEAAMRRRFHQDLLAYRRRRQQEAAADTWETLTTTLNALAQGALDAWKGLQPLIAAFQRAQISTRDQYVLYPNDFPPDVDHKPTDPRARALWLRQHRNTGPTRPNAQTARRPR